jgi:ABC-type uncharacterized transport system auxiliary subunit
MKTAREIGKRSMKRPMKSAAVIVSAAAAALLASCAGMPQPESTLDPATGEVRSTAKVKTSSPKPPLE